MHTRRFWRAVVRIGASLLCAVLFYAAWMVVFLLALNLESPAVETILWLLVPVITAAGFATGITLRQRLAGSTGPRFLRIFLWPLIGCAVGAGTVYRFGPMLIVFAMLFTGTASIALREVVGFLRSGEPARD